MTLYDPYGHVVRDVGMGANLTRQDRWENNLTGIGTAADKTVHGRFFPVWRVMDDELVNLWNGSDLAKKIVEKVPTEMFRCGYDAEADGVSTSQAEKFHDWLLEEFDFDEVTLDSFRWGRLFGGGLLVMGLNDGREMWQPLDEDNIRSLDYLNWVDRRYAYAMSQYAQMNAPSYGKVEVYLISNAIAGAGWNSYGPVRAIKPEELRKSGANISLVHESRCIRFDGNAADLVTRQRLAGWNWSVLQVVYDAMRQFEHAFDSAGYLLADASQGVFKLHGLMKAITAGQRQALADRVAIMEMTRSVARGVALDAGNSDGKGAEDFTRIATPFGGVADVLDRMMLRLAAAVDMPATELFGRAPAGLNATGESDIRKWYDTIASMQKSVLAPKQRRIMRLAAKAKNSPLRGKDTKWRLSYRPLWSPADDEVAKARLANAQRDDIYLNHGVVTPAEVGVDLGHVYPHLDVEAREEMVKSKEFQPYGIPFGAVGGGVGPTDAGEPQSPSTPMATIGKQGGPSERSVGGTPLIGSDKPGQKPAKVSDRADSRISNRERPADEHEDSTAIARAIRNQLSDDYAEHLLNWIDEASWQGPKRVPVSKVDFSNKEHWTAWHDKAHVDVMRERISEGIEKPVILVKEPGRKTLVIVDGHHRALAYLELGRPLKAYVATVKSEKGPWSDMHSRQQEGSYKSQQK